MPFAYWCVLIAALLPLPFVAYAKSGSRDNNTPRDSADKLEGAKRRAYAAHQNIYENFPFFAAAVIIAITQGANAATVSTLAAIYVVLRIAYGICYIKDAASLRSLCYMLSLFANIAIIVLPAFR